MVTSEDELTKLAVDSLLKDAMKFSKKREMEFRATQQKQEAKQVTMLNKSFLKNLLSNNNSHNRRVDKRQKSVDFSQYKRRMEFLGKSTGECSSYITKEQRNKRANDTEESNEEKDIIEISDSDTTDDGWLPKKRKKNLKTASKRHKTLSSSDSESKSDSNPSDSDNISISDSTVSPSSSSTFSDSKNRKDLLH